MALQFYLTLCNEYFQPSSIPHDRLRVYLSMVESNIQWEIPQRQGDDMMWVVIKQTCAIVHSASVVLHAVLYMSQQYSLHLYIIPPATRCIYQNAVSSFLSLRPLTSKSSLLLLWQHNPDVCHFHRPGWATHMMNIHKHMYSGTPHRNHFTHTHASIHMHTQTLFCQRGFSPTQGQSGDTSSWAKWSKSGKERRRERGEMEGWMERNDGAIWRGMSGAICQRGDRRRAPDFRGMK